MDLATTRMDDKHVKIGTAQMARIRRRIATLALPLILVWLFFRVFVQPWFSTSDRLIRNDRNENRLKILYVVTTLSEYDSGSRDTIRGFDRLQETLIPVVRESVESMVQSGFDLDVVIISHYNMTRRFLIKAALPPSVGLQFWDNATPLGYKLEDSKHNYTQSITRALARQHRYLVKDKLAYYDFFVVFEDDMLITGDIVHNFMNVSDEISRLREKAPETKPDETNPFKNFDGPLTKAQLQRMIPGIMRVEVLLDEEKYGTQTELDPVPITDLPAVDPIPCCHLRNPLTVNRNRPPDPKSDDLIMWETSITALGVRKMPEESNLDWVLMQRGPRVSPPLHIGDYWSGRDGYFNTSDAKVRPDTRMSRYINNQGGWMASRKQLWEWDEICPGGFLPPFEDPEYELDGLDKRNVEYWSGGLSIFTKEHGCNFQRIIPLDPDRFARSLLYHTANNKQRQFASKRSILVKVNHFLGQLNTVRKNAETRLRVEHRAQ